MCGIVGYIGKKEIANGIFEASLNTIAHRGPDSKDYVTTKLCNKNILLGHVRLSIIDLSNAANQPMHSFDKNYTIVFNGEIYNYNEIKEELIKIGYKFYTNSDTEVIINAFDKWGESCVNKFIGMFSFALLIKSANKIILCRDRVGVKPLYYYYNKEEEALAFASELKPLIEIFPNKKEISFNGRSLFFKYGYIPEPYTIYKEFYKLESGTFLEIELKNFEFSKKRFWFPENELTKLKNNFTYDEAVTKTEELLESSVKYRNVADVEVGVFLSGGYDSSLVSAMLQKSTKLKIKTFTIGFEQQDFDESNTAKEVAQHLGTDHYEKICTLADFQNTLLQLPKFYDEPFADSSAIPTMLVSSFASKYVKVVLSADGGDEQFAGYNKYDHIKNMLKIRKYIPYVIFKFVLAILNFLNFKKFAPKFAKKLSVISQKNIMNINKELSSYYSTIDYNNLFFNTSQNQPLTNFDLNISNEISEFEKVLFYDYKTYLTDDILTKVDRATMSASIEGREPLLDHRIFELVSKLQMDFKYSANRKKRILKDIVEKYIPKHILDKPKKGFSIPLKQWLEESKSIYSNFLTDEYLKQVEGINIEEVKRIFSKSVDNDSTIIQKRWILLNYLLWYNQYIWSK